MSIKFECGRCGRRYEVGDDLAGKRVKCKECGEIVGVPSPGVEVISAADVLDEDRGRTPGPVDGSGAGASGSANPVTATAPAPVSASSGVMADVAAWSDRVLGEVGKVFVGQHDLLRGVLVALLADGHVLIESVPGLGKTLLVRALGRVLGCTFRRIQFTPDLMPSDVTGSPIFDEKLQDFRFRPGPVFTQLLLADEINRAPAKTHSALLEIMQETRVTVDGVPHVLERPFLVLATQNPIESEGTYNLPEAQLDRFLFKLLADYPSVEEETNILRLHSNGHGPDVFLTVELEAVTHPAEILDIQLRCASVLVDERMLGYIAALVRQTRQWPAFALGASPRAGVSILRAARAVAALEGRDFVVPDDVQEVTLPALRHRVILTPEAEVEGRKPDDLLAELIRSIEVPRR
ncbi:MAG TPA: MoxR family ATPase [Isosphaeraceae bacterium]